MFSIEDGFRVGDKLVASVWVKADVAVTVGFYLFRANATTHTGNKYSSFNVTTKWQRIWFPFVATEYSTTTTDTRIEHNKTLTNNNIYWAGWKLEKGNKPTDWTPAPEDIENYTDTQIATAKSEIKQTTDSINLEVSKKVNNSDLTGANILLRINNDESEAKINADKIDIDGKAVHFKTNIKETVGPFTEADRQKVIDFIMDRGELTTEEFKKYDIDGDNYISACDATLIQRAVLNGGYYTFNGTFEINPYSAKQTIDIINGSTSVATISPLKNYFNELFVDRIYVEEYFGFTDENGERRVGISGGTVEINGNLWIHLGFFNIDDTNVSLQNGDFSVKNGSVILGSNEDSNKVNFDLFPKSDANIWGNLDVRGNVYANNISSDRRLKENIKDAKISALDKIKQIKHKQFKMKTDEKHYDIGYIAQDLEKIDENFVLKRETSKEEKLKDYQYYVNELPIIATATKAIQEEDEKVEMQNKLILQMQKEIENLKKQIQELREEK